MSDTKSLADQSTIVEPPTPSPSRVDIAATPEAKRRSANGVSPIGSERGNSPNTLNKLAGSTASLVSSGGDSSHRSAGGVEDMSGSGLLDPSDKDAIQAVSFLVDVERRPACLSMMLIIFLPSVHHLPQILQRLERKKLEHERQRALQRQQFEKEMQDLEQRQKEAEAALARGQDPETRSSSQDSATFPKVSNGTAARASYELPPPASVVSASSHLNSSGFRGLSAGPAHGSLGSGLQDLNDTEDGLNGSNVPGLPPLNSTRSVPPTRRPSREATVLHQSEHNNDSQRRSVHGGDLANSFNRMNLGAPGITASAPVSGNGTPLAAGPPGQGSASQRLLARNALDNVSHSGGDNTGMTPNFSERFFFDDEDDAEDSAFVQKYNLTDRDDRFPTLLRNENGNQNPSTGTQLSASSAALDLASGDLRNQQGRTTTRNASQLSEWPQFETSGRSLGASGGFDQRGRSERGASPNIAAAISGSGRPPPAVASGTGLTGLSAHSGLRAGPPSSAAATGAFGASSSANGIQQRRPVTGNPTTGGFPSFGLDNGPPAARGALNSFSTSGGYDGNAALNRRPNSAYFQAFGNGSGMNSAFGFDSDTIVGDPASDEFAGRQGELDINTRLEDMKGDIFTLCKDQHGCRYLQKKLEEGVPAYRDMIFSETFEHFAELMTDPFGNYLCQKMLEYCTDDQRNRIVESVASELVTISLNMHGTRAVQKTIDFLSTSRQIHSIIAALTLNVVTLIKDLNGNHVIQKCLNRLGAEDNQFIYNAVAAHCVEVATHRHGCCVLQRCVDHASDKQRVQLVNEITYNALTLVQDPFGNYVVQYILDLNDARFTELIIRQFIGNVCLLSVQKFSSNVIEKCIRVSDVNTRRLLVEELLNRARLEKLLRDSFANYVVQTALDYSEPVQRAQLVECIRPILPMIRNTPYGKRIQSKLHRDNFDSNGHSGNHGGMQHVPYHVLQAAAQQQQHLQAMAAMAGNRGAGMDGYGGMNAYNATGNFGGGRGPVSSLPAPHQLYSDNGPRGGYHGNGPRHHYPQQGGRYGNSNGFNGPQGGYSGASQGRGAYNGGAGGYNNHMGGQGAMGSGYNNVGRGAGGYAANSVAGYGQGGPY